jgi:hypothetical protein
MGDKEWRRRIQKKNWSRKEQGVEVGKCGCTFRYNKLVMARI